MAPLDLHKLAHQTVLRSFDLIPDPAIGAYVLPFLLHPLVSGSPVPYGSKTSGRPFKGLAV